MVKKVKSIRAQVIAATIVALLILVTILTYALGPTNGFAAALAQALPIPAAKVGGSFISRSRYSQNVIVLEKTLGKEPTKNQQINVLDQLIDNAVIADQLSKMGLSVSESDLNSGYEYLQKIFGKKDVASEYGLAEAEFKELILKPDLLQAKLAIALNKDKDLNSEAYAKLDNALKELSGGTSFKDVAEKYSDDKFSATIGGELGFVSYRDIVEEYYNELHEITDRDPHIAVSRHGVFIFTVLDKDEKGPEGSARYNLRHIFLKTKDFNDWLD